MIPQRMESVAACTGKPRASGDDPRFEDLVEAHVG